MFKIILTLVLFFSMSATAQIIFDFGKSSNIQSWRIEDDRVMGGISQGEFDLNEDGHGFFHGIVTVESNGGFSSVQNNSYDLDVEPTDHITIRLKGDGHNFQLRVKDSQDTYYSYQKDFKTSGEWETIVIPLSEMQPTYRGRSVNQPNFDKNHISQLRLMIGTKMKQEPFELLIDKIELVKA